MKKNSLQKLSFLVVLLLVLQVVSPITAVYATTGGTMLPPSNLSHQMLTPNDVRLSWTAVNGASGYNVYEITEGQLIKHGSTTNTAYTINNLAEGTYSYVVTTLTVDGESGPGAPITITIEYPEMMPPTLSHLIRNGNDIILNWTASLYVQKYNIYQIDEENQRTFVTSTTSRTFSFTDLPEGTYKYGITSEHSTYGESALSNEVEVEIIHPTMEAPGNFTFTITNNTDVTLRWNNAAYATDYKIYEVINGEKILKSSVTGTTVRYNNLPVGDYTYEIHSFSNRFGESINSSQVNVTIGSITMTAPETFAYTVQNVNDVSLTWSAVSDVTNYRVYQIIDGERVLKSTLTGRTVTYTNLPAGEYTFEVYSYNDRFGESAEGNQLTLTVGTHVMERPSDFNYRLQNVNDVVLTWNPVAYNTNYRVYEIVNGERVLRSTITGTSVTYPNRPEGNYTYEVFSYSNKFGESPEGSQVSLTIVHPTIKAPKNLTYTINNSTDFTLRWDAAENANNYRVYQIVDGQKVLRSTVTNPVVTYTKMPPGDYLYVVHTNSTRFGESLEGTSVTLTLDGQIIDPPTNLTYSIANGNDITLRWTGVTDANRYYVYQIIDGERVLRSNITGTQVTYSNQPEGNYSFEVYSFSTLFGESIVAAEIAFELIHPVMEAPANIAYNIQNGNDVVLTWDRVDYATRYLVYGIVDGEKVLLASPTTLTARLNNVTEGVHTYIVHSTSTRFGDSIEGSEIEVDVVYPDMEAPGNPNESFANGNDIILRWNAVTYATAYRVYQIVDGEKILRSTVTTLTARYNNMPEGDYEYVVHSFSSRFGESVEGSKVSFTLVWPTMAAPKNFRHSVTNGNDLILRWDAAEYATAYRVYEIVDGVKVLRSTVTGTTVRYNGLAEGDYQYEVHAFSSRFGESLDGSLLDFTMIWPVVQPPSLSRTISNINNISFSWTPVEWVDDYRVYHVTEGKRTLLYQGKLRSFTVHNLSEDTHSFEVTAYSTRFGESVASNTITETIIYPEMQPPVASLTVLSDDSVRILWNFITYANGYNVYQIIDNQPVLLVENLNNLSFTVNNLSPTNHQFYVTSFSNSFGESEASNRVIAELTKEVVPPVEEDEKTPEETVPPVTTTTLPTGWTNEDVEIILSATDDESGVAQTFYSVNGGDFTEGTTFTITEEGINIIAYFSVDEAGNIEAVNTAEVKIDKTAPIITMELDEMYTLGDELQLNYSAIDHLSGIATEEMKVTAPGETVAVVIANGTEITLDKPGIYTITVTATNNAGITTTIEKQVSLYIPATIEVMPRVIKGNKGVFTVRVTLPDGSSTNGFDLTTATLNGVNALARNNGSFNQAKNGLFHFERSDFPWEPSTEVLVEFRGYVDGVLVIGHATVKVQK